MSYEHGHQTHPIDTIIKGEPYPRPKEYPSVFHNDTPLPALAVCSSTSTTVDEHNDVSIVCPVWPSAPCCDLNDSIVDLALQRMSEAQRNEYSDIRRRSLLIFDDDESPNWNAK